MIAYMFFLLVEGPLLSLNTIGVESKEVREGTKTLNFKFMEISAQQMPMSRKF
jgi:hypothetical protein